MKNKLRIISGHWRSRQIFFEDAMGLRPTPARIRETLFNWLQQDVRGSLCLDLYAGSGAIGFEAASRGAKSVVMVEKNGQTCRTINENKENLLAQQIKILQMDVFRYLAENSSPFNLVFLDPPFAKGMVQQTCHWLEDKNWLAGSAKIYIEAEAQLELDNLPVNWQCLNNKKAGEVGYYLYQRQTR